MISSLLETTISASSRSDLKVYSWEDMDASFPRIIKESSVGCLQSDGLGARALIEALALDRWEAARFLGPRLRFVLVEFLQNEHTRALIPKLFEKYIWVELVAAVRTLQARGELRPNLQAEALARHILMAVLGHGLLRGVVHPEASFDDPSDLEVMLEILLRGIRCKP